MPLYHIEWTIDLPAGTPREAAQMAFAIMQKPGTTATDFTVKGFDSPDDAISVDLLEDEREDA